MSVDVALAEFNARPLTLRMTNADWDAFTLKLEYIQQAIVLLESLFDELQDKSCGPDKYQGAEYVCQILRRDIGSLSDDLHAFHVKETEIGGVR